MAFSTLLPLITFVFITATHFTTASSRVLERGPPGPGKKGPVTCQTGQKTANAACCALFPAIDLIQRDLFDGGKCGEGAHSALRLVFHDAIGYSILGTKGGGADGSILAFNQTESAYPANEGISDITDHQYPVWQQSGLSAGDFVHLAGVLGTGNCPGAPKLNYMFGRPAPKAPAPPGTVPEPTDSTIAILLRFADAGFSPAEAVALLASHSIAAVDELDPSAPGTPLDSTVDIFDTQFYLEVLLKGTSYPGSGPHPGEVKAPIVGEMRLESDFNIARDPMTSCLWQQMVGDQNRMMSQFKDAMARLQVLGQPSNQLIDCSDVIPAPPPLPKKYKITFPPTLSSADLELKCPLVRLPKIDTAPGPAMTLTPVDVD